MKKNLLLAGAVLFSALHAQGQQNPMKIRKEKNQKDAMIHSILNKQFSSTTARKPTGLQQRVIAQGLTDIDGTDISLDSFLYKYTGTNGSKYDYNQIGYNTTFEPVYAPMRLDHRYDFDPLNLLADTIINYYEGELYEIDRAYYRADKKLDSTHAYMGSGLTNRSNNIIAYNASGNIQTIYTIEDYSGSGLDTYSVHKYYYNTANTQVIADTVRMDDAPGTYFGYRYTYNTASGKLDTSYSTFLSTSFENKSRAIYDYYSDGKLRKVTMQQFESGAWKTTGRDSIGYTIGINYYTYWKQSAVYSGGPVEEESSYLTEQYPGVGDGPDSTWQYTWDDEENEWIPAVKMEFDYNSFGNPVKITATSVESGDPESLGHMNFYYETYEDGLAIKPVAENKDFSVYPNPFSNNINIDWKGKQQSNVTVRLTNVIGQEVFKTALKLSTGNNSITAVPSMNSGNYILLIQDVNGKTWSSKLVKK